MSIKPPSDIVLDVARAADPARAIAATTKLARMGEAAGADFSSVLGASPGSEGSGRAALRSQLAFTGASHANAASGSSGANVYKGLEQLVLQHLVENMLPKESGFFGSGSAGDVWRSMLAEQLAGQIGKSVDLGLGKASMPALGG